MCRAHDERARRLRGSHAARPRRGTGFPPVRRGVRRLQGAIEKIGSSRVYLLPVHASADASRTLGDAAKLAIEDELAALKAEVEEFMASPPTDRPRWSVGSTHRGAPSPRQPVP